MSDLSTHSDSAYRSTLLGEDLGLDYAECADGRGKVRIWHFARHVAVAESSGGIDATHARFLVDYFRQYVEPLGRPFYAFGNWSFLVAYEPEVRRILTEWQLATPYDEVHVSHDSRLLALSVAVANSVLATKIEVHPSPEHMDDAFLAIKKRHGL